MEIVIWDVANMTTNNHIQKKLEKIDEYHRLTDWEKGMVQKITQIIDEEVRKEEWKRCVDLLDFDHKKCPLPQSCIGYQNAQSELVNQPPHSLNKET